MSFCTDQQCTEGHDSVPKLLTFGYKAGDPLEIREVDEPDRATLVAWARLEEGN
jgi:hypothetical protein